jgi:predicted dienelactone hydrolase
VRRFQSVNRPPERRVATRVKRIAALLLALLIAAPPILFPVPRVPPPTGSHAVGTITLHLVDRSRTEMYGLDPAAPREFIAQLWYPADPAPGSQPAPWLDRIDVYGPAIAARVGLPSFFLDHIQYARASSFRDAPLAAADRRYPVLIFSHGWGGFRVQNTYQMEDLASHGYVVVALEHSYAAAATLFPDGRTAPFNPATLWLDAPTEEAFDTQANRLVTQWAGDMAFTLDHLESLAANDPSGRFTGRLDLDRVGVLGHSTGGGAAIEFCGRDPRCKAGLTMDAFMAPVSKSILAGGLEQPFLFMFSEQWPSARNTQLFEQLYAASDGTADQMSIAGTAHYDFSDMPMVSPLAAAIGLKGPLEASRVLSIIRSYGLAFFDAHLRGSREILLAGPSPDYPEVTFEARNP